MIRWVQAALLEDLPFAPVDLEGCSAERIAELVSECQVDQSVPSVSQYTPGGSEAGAHPLLLLFLSLLLCPSLLLYPSLLLCPSLRLQAIDGGGVSSTQKA